MPTPARTLNVYANPYHHLDEKGRPCGACPMAFDERAPARRYVGAMLKAEVSREAQSILARGPGGRMVAMQIAPEQHDRYFEFSAEPVLVSNEDDQQCDAGKYYRSAIMRGELVAADLATWIAAGGSKDSFVDPLTLLDEMKAAAIAAYEANHGETPEATAAHSMRPAVVPAPMKAAPAKAPAATPSTDGSK